MSDSYTDGKRAEEAEIKTEEKKAPSLFTKKDNRYRVEITVSSDPGTGVIQLIIPKAIGVPIDAVSALGGVISELWFDFSIPGFEEMEEYNQRAGEYINNQLVVNPHVRRRFLITRHLKEWNLTDSDGSPAPLVLDASGFLSADSIEAVGNLCPRLMEIVLDTYEKQALLLG